MPFTLLFPRRVRCFSCQSVGPSRLSLLYRALFLICALLAFATYDGSLSSPGAFLADLGALWQLFGAAALLLFFARRAHHCRQCGSEYVRPAS